jgi:hypothetical protein
LDIRLAVSRDGVHWTYPDQSKAFIPLGDDGAWDSKSLYMGQNILQIGDQTYLYYSGSALPHNATDEEYFNAAQPRSFSRTVLERDRFVSVDAGTPGGSFVTLPLDFTGDALRLNVDVREGGSVRVALLDENGVAFSGFGLSDCLPITGDQLDAVVRWNSGSDVGSLVGRSIKMQVEMVDASLYGFQFSAVPEPSSLATLTIGAVLAYLYMQRRRWPRSH